MPTSVADIILAVRNRTDMLNDNFVTDNELMWYINSSCAELDDMLVQTFDDYKLTSTSLTITENNYVALPPDFYKPRGVDVFIDSVQPYSVRPFNFQERNRYANTLFRGPTGPYNVRYRVQDGYFYIEPVSAAPGTYTLWYTPAWQNFTSTASILPTYMDIQVWHEYATVDASIKVKMKLELDPGGFMALKEPLRQRILAMNKSRAQAEGKTISAVRQEMDDLFGWYGSGTNGTY